jgi:hypothetical protein
MEPGRRAGALAVAATLVLAPVVSLVASGISAFAVGAKPPTDTTYYVMTTKPATFYQYGYNQGAADAANGNANSVVVLDFGGQQSNDSGTIKPKTSNVFYSWATVENLAEEFAAGYWLGTGYGDPTSVLELGIGTNNSAYNVSSTGGAKFASAVNVVRNWLINSGYASQISIWGANDIEPGYDTYAPTASWISGWTSTTVESLLDFGSADGCPQTTHTNGGCNNGWNQNDIWNVSWGDPPSFAAPEIYVQGQANEWGQIRYWKSMEFQGPLDEYPLDTSTFKSTAAWNALWTASGGVGQFYSLEIRNST